MHAQVENAEFSAYDAIYAWPAIMADMQTQPPVPLPDAIAHAALIDDETSQTAPVDYLMGAAYVLAFLLGNALFDWFAPVCSAGETLLVGAGALLAFSLLFRHPLLALGLAFCLGDPAMDVYGHCIMGL
jgi:hypothetical protein